MSVQIENTSKRNKSEVYWGLEWHISLLRTRNLGIQRLLQVRRVVAWVSQVCLSIGSRADQTRHRSMFHELATKGTTVFAIGQTQTVVKRLEKGTGLASDLSVEYADAVCIENDTFRLLKVKEFLTYTSKMELDKVNWKSPTWTKHYPGGKWDHSPL